MKTLIYASNEARTNFPAAFANVLAMDSESEGMQWVQLSPYGEFPHVNGLQVMDRQAANTMVSEFNSFRAKMANRFRGAPFYVGHPDDAETGSQYPDKRAHGWIKELEARQDGLWARVKWSTTGKTFVNEGHFQYVSPYWGMEPVEGRRGAYRPVVLVSAGLTNDPNIPVLAVGPNQKQKHDAMTPEELEQLRKALGLKADATATAIIAAANAAHTALGTVTAANTAKTDLEGKLTEAKNESTRLSCELKTANAAIASAEEKLKGERKARINDILTGAVNEGRIKEAQRPEWAGKLAADFDAELPKLAALKPALNTKQRTGGLGDRKPEVSNGSRVTAINTKVQAHLKANGGTHHDAFMAVKNDPANAELFRPEGDGDEE